MDRKKLVLLLVALVVAVGTALAARSMFAGSSAPEVEAAPVPEGPKVLVAQRALPTGTIITADALSFQQWPEELVQDAYFLDGESDINQLLGTVVRHSVTAGEPVTQGSLVSPGDRGFLAAALGPGMRAVTVPVSAKTGVAGFVFPGDRVDLVLTQTVTGDDGRTIVRAFKTVTLEVTPTIAEKVAVAQTIGTLSLALRSIADNQAELERAIASGDVVIPDDATPEEEERILRAAMNRPAERGTSVSTGGDVSRFQRRTMPVIEAAQPKNADGTPIVPGPKVRVSRGSNTSEVTLGNAGTALNLQNAQNVRAGGQMVPIAGKTVIR